MLPKICYLLIASILLGSCQGKDKSALYTINTRHLAAARISKVRIHAIDPMTEVWR